MVLARPRIEGIETCCVYLGHQIAHKRILLDGRDRLRLLFALGATSNRREGTGDLADTDGETNADAELLFEDDFQFVLKRFIDQIFQNSNAAR